jgi:pimeloyl-ACP methyl ester carboxylesterase
MMIRYPIHSIAAKATLAGTAMGRQMLAQLIAVTRPVNVPTVVYLDFGGIDIATGSFLREAVLGFRDFGRNAIGTLYPVLANANTTIEEELSVYLKDRNDAIWACSLSEDGAALSPHILGELDLSQMNTLQLISQHQPISAPELAKLRPTEGIGTTAWNNRLATLAAKGILMELKQGKTKLFAPVLEDNSWE